MTNGKVTNGKKGEDDGSDLSETSDIEPMEEDEDGDGLDEEEKEAHADWTHSLGHMIEAEYARFGLWEINEGMMIYCYVQCFAISKVYYYYYINS